MKKMLVLVLSIFMFTSCASIVKGKEENFKIISRSNSIITVKDSYGRVIKSGKGSLNVSLNKGKGAFEGATYEVSSDLEKVFIEPKLNIGAFAIGNFFVPTWLGYVVDGVTGAMWDLKVNGVKTNSIELR